MTAIQPEIVDAFAPFAGGKAVYLPVDRDARKYRAVEGHEFMFMHRDDRGFWLKHRGTRNYLLVKHDGTPVVVVGRPGELFLGGFYGDAEQA